MIVKSALMQISSEHQECKAFWQYAQNIPMLREYLIKIPNEGKRESWYGRSLKNIGLRPGLPDYYYPVHNDTWHGLWLEMKRKDVKKSALKQNHLQNEWIEKLIKIGHYACYVYGWEDAVNVYNDYIGNRI